MECAGGAGVVDAGAGLVHVGHPRGRAGEEACGEVERVGRALAPSGEGGLVRRGEGGEECGEPVDGAAEVAASAAGDIGVASADAEGVGAGVLGDGVVGDVEVEFGVEGGGVAACGEGGGGVDDAEEPGVLEEDFVALLGEEGERGVFRAAEEDEVFGHHGEVGEEGEEALAGGEGEEGEVGKLEVLPAVGSAGLVEEEVAEEVAGVVGDAEACVGGFAEFADARPDVWAAVEGAVVSPGEVGVGALDGGHVGVGERDDGGRDFVAGEVREGDAVLEAEAGVFEADLSVEGVRGGVEACEWEALVAGFADEGLHHGSGETAAAVFGSDGDACDAEERDGAAAEELPHGDSEEE